MAILQTQKHSQQQDALDETLALVAGRVRNQRWWRGGVRGLSAALAVDIVLAALSRADLLPDGPLFFLLLFAVAAIGAALGAYWASRFLITPMDAARLAEARLPLKERLSSALEFDETSRSSSLFALQHADAEAHARALDTRRVVPRRAPREAWLVLPLLLALALMLWLPNLPFASTPAQRAERETVQQAGRRLAQAAHQAARQADARHQEGAKRQAQKMEALGKRMAQGHMGRAQALAAVSQQEQQLAEQGGAASPNSNGPGQAAKDLAGANQSPPSSDTQSPMSPKGESNSGAPPHSQSALAGQGGPQNPSQFAKQAQLRTAQGKPSGPAAHSAAPRNGANVQNGGGSPDKQVGQGKAAQPPPPARPASSSDTAHQATEAASRQSQPPSPSSGAPEARQALENARRRLAGPGPTGETPPAKPAAPDNQSSSPAPLKPGSTPQSGASGKPGSASFPGADKPDGQGKGVGGRPNGVGKPGDGKINGAGKPGIGEPNGQSQGSGVKPNGPPPSAGKGQDGQTRQGKPTGQSLDNPGGSPGTPAPGGGAGRAAKAPFRGVLPPTTASKGQGIYLGAPRQGAEQGKSLRKQSGLPPAPGGPSRVPYGQALPRYRKGAESALDQEQVPPSQRAVVRRYFNLLQPAK